MQKQDSCLQIYHFVNSVRQNTLPTRKEFPETTTTCIWLTLSYEAWCYTSMLNKICMLVPEVIISFIKSRFEKARGA